MTPILKAVRYHIHGRVQGVGFRYFTQNQARSLNIGGWVRNEEDGSVMVFAVGEPQNLQSFQQALSQGPRFSKVLRIDPVDLNLDDVSATMEFAIVR